jgi:hypothetical protein
MNDKMSKYLRVFTAARSKRKGFSNQCLITNVEINHEHRILIINAEEPKGSKKAGSKIQFEIGFGALPPFMEGAIGGP